jgi:hypothetical protein
MARIGCRAEEGRVKGMTKIKYAALAIALSAGAMGAFAQKGSGTKFGARDARTCPSRKEPVKGSPSAAQLKQYVICDLESAQTAGASGAYLYLVANVNVEVGKGRPFNILTDSYADVDPAQTVYPIRGTYMQWQCSEPRKPIPGVTNAPVAGKNCFKYETPSTASGISYKDTFGDWHTKICCVVSSSGSRVEFVAPPAVQ